jgi:hypothetical protein
MCSRSNKLSSAFLFTERDFIIAFSKVKFDEREHLHYQMLYTCFAKLRDSERCFRYGKHWERIGFQGTDPATDLRGAGMLGVLQFLAFVCKYHIYLRSEVLPYADSEANGFPLAITLLNFTCCVLNYLKDGRLTEMINQEK